MKDETIFGLILVGLGAGILAGAAATRADYLADPSVKYVQAVSLPDPEPYLVKASWYGQEYCRRFSPKCVSANGSKFDENQFTAACDRRWPLGNRLRLAYGGKTVQVLCTDRGSFKKYGRSLDLSKASFASLAPISRGVIEVEVTTLK